MRRPDALPVPCEGRLGCDCSRCCGFVDACSSCMHPFIIARSQPQASFKLSFAPPLPSLFFACRRVCRGVGPLPVSPGCGGLLCTAADLAQQRCTAQRGTTGGSTVVCSVRRYMWVTKALQLGCDGRHGGHAFLDATLQSLLGVACRLCGDDRMLAATTGIGAANILPLQPLSLLVLLLMVCCYRSCAVCWLTGDLVSCWWSMGACSCCWPCLGRSQ